MRDLRPELFVEAYKATKLEPIRGAYMGIGFGTREACGLSALAIHEDPSCEMKCRGFGTEAISVVIGGVVGMREHDVRHFSYVWDHGLDKTECDGCDVCAAAAMARDAVEREFGPVRRRKQPTVRPHL